MSQTDVEWHQVTVVDAEAPCGDETCYEHYSHPLAYDANDPSRVPEHSPCELHPRRGTTFLSEV